MLPTTCTHSSVSTLVVIPEYLPRGGKRSVRLKYSAAYIGRQRPTFNEPGGADGCPGDVDVSFIWKGQDVGMTQMLSAGS